jgi:hypothetical protein
MPPRPLAPRVVAIALVGLFAVGTTACRSSAKTAAPTTTTASGAADFCNLIKSSKRALDVTHLDPNTSPAQVKALYLGLVTKFNTAQQTAPGPIKDDVETVATAIDKLTEALGNADYEYAKLNPLDLVGIAGSNLPSALQNISSYLSQRHCDITT